MLRQLPSRSSVIIRLILQFGAVPTLSANGHRNGRRATSDWRFGLARQPVSRQAVTVFEQRESLTVPSLLKRLPLKGHTH
jgi:hypothetical protein